MAIAILFGNSVLLELWLYILMPMAPARTFDVFISSVPVNVPSHCTLPFKADWHKILIEEFGDTLPVSAMPMLVAYPFAYSADLIIYLISFIENIKPTMHKHQSMIFWTVAEIFV